MGETQRVPVFDPASKELRKLPLKELRGISLYLFSCEP